MYNDFISIKEMGGELKLSHKNHHLGLTVSTRELIIQKPHVNYHVELSSIVSIMPFEFHGSRKLTITNQNASGREFTNHSVGSRHFKIYATDVWMHNRSGIYRIGPTEFILPIIGEILEAVSHYGGMDAIRTG
ncbi:hypothetical protein N6H14_25765 [Paenibacillus sp. CC-CFT747]|nr:hypothetical protein N6H14_25765 [Paenibacillus sp. CC-CFT747]